MGRPTPELSIYEALPAESADSLRTDRSLRADRNDVRSGCILVGVGAGLVIFFTLVGAPQVAGIGAIPGLIGVALLLYALLSSVFSSKNR